MSKATIEERLKSVIASLEYEQSKHYNPLRNFTLAYLYDILNDKVPERILETKKAQQSFTSVDVQS